MNCKIKLIVAMSDNYIIGNNNKLLWDIKEDMKLFKETTKNSIVVMGRKTYESIGKPLENRINVILTKDHEFVGTLNAEDIFITNNLRIYNSFNQLYKKLNELSENDTVFVIGGRQLYKQFLDKSLIDEMFISHIKGNFEGDTKFPFVDFKKYSLIHKKDYKEFIFKKYKKILDK